MRFCELRKKEVVNLHDGKSLGCICDLKIDLCNGKICSIIVPGPSCWKDFYKEKIYVIPWCNICKIGEDVILVEVDIECLATSCEP